MVEESLDFIHDAVGEKKKLINMYQLIKVCRQVQQAVDYSTLVRSELY